MVISWVVNASVSQEYQLETPAAHISAIAELSMTAAVSG